jgi:3D (Asp-Asp-Asp) domain-containing protein
MSGFQANNSIEPQKDQRYIGQGKNRHQNQLWVSAALFMKGITKSGEPIIPGISVAIDERYWPFGTVFYIKGLGYTVAMDTGSAVKGKYRFDFSVLDRDFAMQLGSRKWDVYLVKMGNGNVKDVKL